MDTSMAVHNAFAFKILYMYFSIGTRRTFYQNLIKTAEMA
jgi:hypothetical protein